MCKLKKALYGLKQSLRAWLNRLSKALTEFGYKQRNAYHTIFIKGGNGKITILIVDFHDIVVTKNDSQDITKLRDYLAKSFEIKDLGKL